ncbi:TonB-dependent receptor [Massilia psychrophila]|uniref:TonB-dependent receptor n=1 Tax=Massilia psychrophila TaxID=1603353 RepID=A0A2G8T0A0_9BURK|nr:TonB-dependent receptor [Massilia psychrophila]PIL39466.1 TonB-dependent receptor [Massilia psychrophila]GGE76910.1 TonB-dependent receptor [Massilia psychrophila]
MPTLRLTPCALAALLLQAPCRADDDVLQRVLVGGSRASVLGVADSANAGTVDQKQLAARTVYRPGELLEATPGLIVSQHSGEGKANQFYLRGFNLDHGTDLRTTLDDMPVNQRSHAHGQGWTDLNFLMPELATRLDYRKGPYSAQHGDFASAGSAAVTYANRLAQGVASASIGQNGYARAAIAASPEVNLGSGSGNLLSALEVLHNDGPFRHPDDYQKVNGVLRYSQGYANNGFSVTAMAYRATWNATDQVPQRAVDAGALTRFDTIDATDGGAARRYSLSGVWRRTGSDSSSKASAYLIRNQLDLYSNFTYFKDDPVNGDQFSQPDRRITSGFNASHTWHAHPAGLQSSVTIGAQLQNDNVFNGLHNTKARRRLSTTREDHVVETSVGLFVDNSTRWTQTFRTVAGLRADHYRFNVASSLAANSGTSNASLLSPSLSLIFGPWKRTDFYVNAGNGFHSNDARGTSSTIDPRSGQAAGKVPGLVRSRGMEFGVRTEIVPKLQTALSLYRLDFDSELTFVGDAGTTEAGGPSRRIGIEFSNYYKALKWLTVDVDVAFARARSRAFSPQGNHIPGAVEGVGQLALTLNQLGPWSGALRLRYFGPRPLIDNNSVRSKPGTTLNGRIAYQLGKTMKVELEGFNLANRRDSAIDYLYASRLAGEPEARDDIHFHPVESRSARLTLVKNW